LAVLE
jgi:hypothetical protein